MLLELTPKSESSVAMRLEARRYEIAAAAPALQPRIAPWIDEPVIGLHRGRIWLVAPAERDPLRTPDGKYVIPAPALTELRRLAATGAGFHSIAIAHELREPGGVMGDPVPELTDGPRTCTDRVARQLVGRVPPNPGVATLALLMDRIVGGAVTVGSAMANRADRFLRDPIIFGVVGAFAAPVAGEAALWYPLTAWEW
jgi:hypothetical protein